MDQQDFLTIEEAAKCLKKSVQTVRRMIKREELPAKRVKTPQGFQYVVDRQDVFLNGNFSVIKDENEPRTDLKIFSNSPIQNQIQPQYIEEKPQSPIHAPILTSQIDLEPLIENDFYAIDTTKLKNVPQLQSDDFLKILELQHREKMMLIHILERLQEELRFERKTTSLLERLWRKFFG